MTIWKTIVIDPSTNLVHRRDEHKTLRQAKIFAVDFAGFGFTVKIQKLSVEVISETIVRQE